MFGSQPLVDRPPRLAGIIGPEGACSRDRDVHLVRMARIDENRVQTHPAGAWRPVWARTVLAEPGEFLPRLSAIGCAEQGSVFDPGVNSVRIVQRWFEMPDSLELPGVRRPVVPLMSAGNAVVHKFVSDGLPRLSRIVRALDLLPEPAAGLRRI